MTLTATPPSRRGFATGVAGIALVLQATSAFASKEGAALVEPVRWTVTILVIAFAAIVLGSGCLGAFRASKSGESILKGSARGLLKGIVTFVVVCAVLVGLLTVLGLLWVGYSFLQVYVLNPS